jgi:threonine aldolase
MRFLSAPWVGMLESGAWRKNAAHANDCARRFAARIAGLPKVKQAFPVDANSVFLHAPQQILDGLHRRGWHFYSFIGGAARFMFAWDADPAWVDRLADDLAKEAEAFAKEQIVPA